MSNNASKQEVVSVKSLKNFFQPIPNASAFLKTYKVTKISTRDFLFLCSQAALLHSALNGEIPRVVNQYWRLTVEVIRCSVLNEACDDFPPNILQFTS
ncbi:MAG: hypothetical protein M3R45_05370 [Pseudomonadota bacterium]|nr:hypothetical protein [Pseudomonadota bacterium]